MRRVKTVCKYDRNMMKIFVLNPRGGLIQIAAVLFPNDGQHQDDIVAGKAIEGILLKRIAKSL